MKKILTPLLALTSTSALAHSGHMHGDGFHGLLHVEHISLLIAIALVAGFYYLVQKK